MARLINKPVVTTLHNNYFIPENPVFFQENKQNQFFVPISDAQKREIPGLNFTRTVYNAIDIDSYPLVEEKEDFLLSLGNLWEVKGHDTAIEVAKRLGKKLIIAGKLDPKGEDFFNTKIKPQVDGEQIIFEGQISQERKMELFGKASAFLFPIRWEEPFGLVMTEAMACGTPVIAFRHGSVPEVVKDGVTGFIVDTVDQMVEAVGKTGSIDPKACRAHVEENFSPKRMAEGYAEAYEEVLAKSGSAGR
jgi:glycosyltransferase involved in cell wall biosynthesis